MSAIGSVIKLSDFFGFFYTGLQFDPGGGCGGAPGGAARKGDKQ